MKGQVRNQSQNVNQTLPKCLFNIDSYPGIHIKLEIIMKSATEIILNKRHFIDNYVSMKAYHIYTRRQLYILHV